MPTNGRLLRPDVIDRLGDAGVATFNLAVDAVEDQAGLPKALDPIRPYFEHLVKQAVRLRIHASSSTSTSAATIWTTSGS